MSNDSMKDQIFTLFCNQKDTDSEYVAKASREIADEFDFDLEELPERILENICEAIKRDYQDLEAVSMIHYDDHPY